MSDHTPIKAFLRELAASFSGDIATDLATRIVFATDNSVYQKTPAAVIFPKSRDDVQVALKLLGEKKYQTIAITARGGGTGTNGQSLTPGILLDLSRYMQDISDLNCATQTVCAEAGVVLDALNAVVAEKSANALFFAPTLSPSSRATLGGMSATEACGKGSRIYGRTSDHIQKLEWIDLSGEISYLTQDMSESDIQSLPSKQLKQALLSLKSELIEHRDHVLGRFHHKTRFLTGYNLRDVYNPETDRFNPVKLICGAEGTLGVVTKLWLNLLPVPKARVLYVLHYSSFWQALDHAQILLETDPLAIETLDGTVLGLARQDEIFRRVKPFVDGVNRLGEPYKTDSLNIIEFVAKDADALLKKQTEFEKTLSLEIESERVLGYASAVKDTQQKTIWGLRKKGVGLLGKMPGDEKPMPFMEDTVVPPISLGNYAREVAALLDKAGLRYGIFGHVDVGCLHIRPAVDLRRKEHVKLLLDITEKVSTLVEKYHGLFWGEHSRGYRASMSASVFGETLYQVCRNLKTALDPHNQLNPGKICLPNDVKAHVVQIDADLRGDQDRQITEEYANTYAKARHCNGNGACFDVDVKQLLCPSYKATHDRLHSPKGRSALLREWARQKSDRTMTDADKAAFEKDVRSALDGCLGCKACHTLCPVEVNIPSMKSAFMAETLSLKKPLDYLSRYFEANALKYLSWLTKAPAFANLVLKFVQKLPLFPYQDLPKLKKRSVYRALNRSMQVDQTKASDICLVVDEMSYLMLPELLMQTKELLEEMGFGVCFSNRIQLGKAAYDAGFKTQFSRQVQKTEAHLTELQEQGLKLVVLEPSTRVALKDEYRSLAPNLQIHSLPDLLREKLADNQQMALQWQAKLAAQKITWLPHCSERALDVDEITAWQDLFQFLKADIQTPEVGCCGMAGFYGHKKTMQENSKRLYEYGFGEVLEEAENAPDRVCIASGFSCSSQVERFGRGVMVRHPMSFLARVHKET